MRRVLRNISVCLLVSTILCLSACEGTAASTAAETNPSIPQSTVAPTEKATVKPTEAPTEVPTEASTEAPTETASEQSIEPETDPLSAGPLDPVKWEEYMEQFFGGLHSHKSLLIADDFERAMKEYETFISTLFVADLDPSEFRYLSFSETVLKDAALTRESRKVLSESIGATFSYVETHLQYFKIEFQGYPYPGEKVFIDVRVWTVIEYTYPNGSSNRWTLGPDHQLVLEVQEDGSFLLVSDSFDEFTTGAHSSDR